MIYCLTGDLLYTDPLSFTAVVDCGGVGFKVTVTSTTFAKLPPSADLTGKAEKVRLFTYMQVREDAMELFGFYTSDELEMFKLLIGVSGVGPKAAISVLSLFTPDKLASAVGAEDIKAISKAPNVGPKTAARIVLELKDKIAKTFPTLTVSASPAGTVPVRSSGAKKTGGTSLSDAEDALLVLGYSRQQVASALKHVNYSASTEEIIRAALQILMKD